MLATPTITVQQGPYGRHNKLLIPRGEMTGLYSNPPGFFSTINDSNVTLTGIYPLKATDGRDVISDEYTTNHPRSMSLQCTEGDSDYISFWCPMRAEVHLDEFVKKGDCQELNSFALYQSHVLWCYSPRITAVGGGKFWLSLRSVGPHLSVVEYCDEDYNKDGDSSSRKLPKVRSYSGPKNVPPGLRAPPIAGASLWIVDANSKINVQFDLEPSKNDSLVVPKLFTLEELRALTVDGRDLNMICNVIVPSSYFSLSSVIDLTASVPDVPAKTLATVEKILRGEKPDGWDYTLSSGFRGAGDTSVVYYMHSAAMESKNHNIRKVMKSIPASEKDRGGRASLDANGLTAAVQIAYGVEVPLPATFNRETAITLGGMFEDHFTSVVVPQWEREICRRALALDARNPSPSSMVELLRLLNAIWEMPYGRFPVAKRVAVGVLADMMHLSTHASPIDFVQHTVLPSFHESGMNPANLLKVLASLAMHLNTIPMVKKTAVGDTDEESNNEETVDEETEQSPTTPSEPAHFEIAMPPTELPYPEASTDIDPATRTCAIL